MDVHFADGLTIQMKSTLLEIQGEPVGTVGSPPCLVLVPPPGGTFPTLRPLALEAGHHSEDSCGKSKGCTPSGAGPRLSKLSIGLAVGVEQAHSIFYILQQYSSLTK